MKITPWRHYLHFYRASYRSLILSIGASIGQALFVVPITLLVRYAFDHVIPAGDFRGLVLVGLAILGLNLANSGIVLWTRYAMLKITKHVIRAIRSELLERLYTLSRTYYSQADRQQLHASIVQDTERLDIMSNALITQLLPALVISLGLGVVLLLLSWQLFVVMLTVAPFLLIVSRSIGNRFRRKVTAFHRSFETFSKGVLFVLQMIDLTHIQTAEQFEIDRQQANIEDLRQTSRQMAWLATAHVSIQNAVLMIAAILILIVGGMAVANGTMSVGDLLAFYVAVGLLNDYLGMILGSLPPIIDGNESLRTLFQVLNLNDSPPYQGRHAIHFNGKLAFEAIDFSYNDRALLKNIHFTIEPQTTIVIAGPNGAGKTTLIHLILGFYRPQHGRLCADDRPYAELDLIQLRRSIGVVMQDPIIFPGTIWENITYGLPDASINVVIQTARLATAHDFIEMLPLGYETLVGENGILLSGGQRQRIAIARALLRRPSFLILDEPTNHLDEAAVNRLITNLKHLDPTPATLLISHDTRLLHNVDNFYVLHDGQLSRSQFQPAATGADRQSAL